MIGQTVSHYRILQKIGAGGMGEVFLAEDTKLDRKVALKFLPRHLTADKEAQQRFEREAKAAAALNHPNIVTVYEIGEHEGQVFIAMEYVEGQTLKELISVGADPRVCPDSIGIQKTGEHRGSPLPITHYPLPITQVIDIALQISSGLAAAHARGIVHRDIKPQNILIDKDNHVKILDFGLAKLQGASRLTQETFTMGTVHYMSPEQGVGKEVDLRSDIWSLGVVLYEMLAGTLPFHGDYDQAVIYAIVNEEMAPLPETGTRWPPGLEAIIRRCLAKKRQERYPSSDALAAALRDLGGPKADTKPEQGMRRKLSRRAFLTVLSLLLLSGILGFFALNPKARAALGKALGLAGIPREKHMAVLQIVPGGDAESGLLGDGFTAVIIDKLTLLEKFQDSLWTIPVSEIFANRGKTAQTLQRLWNCNLFITGDLQVEKNSLTLKLKLADAKSGRQLRQVELKGSMANLTLFQDGLLPKLLQLLKLPEGPGASQYINTGRTSMPGAYILYLKGRSSLQDGKDAAGIERGIRFLEKSLQQDSGYIQARLALAEALRAKFKLDKNPAWLQEAMGHVEPAMQASRAWAPAKLAWGLVLKESGQRAEAMAAFQEALRLNERCYQACIELAKICTAAGKVNEAEGYYKRAISLRPGYPPAYHNLAYFYDQHGRLDEALSQYEKQAEAAPGDFNCLTNMGIVYLLKGEKASAASMFERSISIQPNVTAQSNLATIKFYDGDYRKALALFEEAASKDDNCRWWGNLADTYRQLPEFKDKAAASYRKAIDMAEAALTKSPDDYELLSVLAMYYAHSGEKAKSLELIARARALAPADLETIRRAILAYEAVGERSRALDALGEYHERLGSSEEIEKEPDLAALCRAPEYAKIVRDQRQ
jgi:serine/threonine protein kinase/tetratricopeptide (TPR) repeat protein